MPVVDMRKIKSLPKKREPRSKLPVLLAVLVVVSAGYFIYDLTKGRDAKNDTAHATHDDQKNTSRREQKSSGLKTFTGEEFKALARAVKYPNTQLFTEPPIITGNKAADARIRKIAEARGYVMTSLPVTAIEKINEPRLDGDDLLQPLAAIAWRDLKAAAKRDGVPLALLSAYRSPEYQRQLFVSRLNATPEQVAAGLADAAVEQTLTLTAVPGYSRHHTGYTIDLWCEDGSGAFLDSTCFQWIKAENYKIAKENGWIPSYPEGVKLQGPEPEPWEYVWVSRDLVMN